MQRFKPQNLRTPGPTPIPDDIVEAMTNPMINHRGPEFDELIHKTTEQLKQVFMTKNDLYILTASGTGSLEAAIVNTLSPGDRVIAATAGAFGDRFVDMAEAYGADVKRMDWEWGGPIDPDAAATEVTDFGRRVTMGQLEQTMIQRVGYRHAGAGRMVYPGLLQLASFISMNSDRHTQAFRDQIMNVARGEAADHDRHNRFYDEYLAVMDMTAEFYLSTVQRIFKRRDIARNDFVVAGHRADFGAITDVAVHIIEGENDDISAPGQCLAALGLLTGLAESKKASHVQPGAGHYGIFAGKSWRNTIRPLALKFIDAHSGN
mgnify:CR=1 FL=1